MQASTTADKEQSKPKESQSPAVDSKSSRKRGREETSEDGETTPVNPAHAPIITNDGMVEFSLAAIHKHLICGLCSGYYKDPYTITDCLHTFCKSCLLYAVACGCHECPECQVYLGGDLVKVATLDHCMQDLLDRIVFPELLKGEEISEKLFYAQRGIEMKPEFAEKEKKKSRPTNHPPESPNNAPSRSSSRDELEFTLMPEIRSTGNNDLPSLDRPCLRISRKFRMNQLKKYIIQKLGLSSSSQPGLDILCNGVPLGDEITLGFAKRLLWHHESDLALVYRIAE